MTGTEEKLHDYVFLRRGSEVAIKVKGLDAKDAMRKVRENHGLTVCGTLYTRSDFIRTKGPAALRED